MSYHGPNTLKEHPDPFPGIREALEQMLAEDPEKTNPGLWQHEADGSVWPNLTALIQRSGRAVYHAHRVTIMSQLGLLPEGYTENG